MGEQSPFRDDKMTLEITQFRHECRENEFKS